MTDKLKTKITRLFGLLTSYRGSTIAMQINAHIVSQQGMKMSEFVQSPTVTHDKKMVVIEELIDIIEDKAWDRLEGEVPSGQVGMPQTVTATVTQTAVVNGTKTAADLVATPEEAKPVNVSSEQNQPEPQAVAKAMNPMEQMEALLNSMKQMGIMKEQVPSSDGEDAIRAKIAGELRPKLAQFARDAAALARSAKALHDSLS